MTAACIILTHDCRRCHVITTVITVAAVGQRTEHTTPGVVRLTPRHWCRGAYLAAKVRGPVSAACPTPFLSPSFPQSVI